MRGKRPGSKPELPASWIIPAHAGQTSRQHFQRFHFADHPRTCGANPLRPLAAPLASGSSPHMRGKRQCDIRHRRLDRIIPAHAGQTHVSTRHVTARPDHPRTCGANHGQGQVRDRDLGSSPHMRGKLSRVGAGDDHERIIPAHAGQTDDHLEEYAHGSDHPRTCGANVAQCAFDGLCRGSSPHMRGKLRKQGICLATIRIIPAHAGQTTPHHTPPPLLLDHPRTCGANRFELDAGVMVLGSSPHMRGKRAVSRRAHRRRRIIPAHAGQTHADTGLPWAKPDHPRTCGANRCCRSHWASNGGSSPHMRGKRSSRVLRICG